MNCGSPDPLAPPSPPPPPPASQVWAAPAALQGMGLMPKPCSPARPPWSALLCLLSAQAIDRPWGANWLLRAIGCRFAGAAVCCGVLEGDVVKFWFCNKSKHQSILSSVAGLPKGWVLGLARMGGLRAAARVPPRSGQQPFPGMGLPGLQRLGTARGG